MKTLRNLQAIYPARASRDGDGVNIQRVSPAGAPGLLDPFLMLDEIASNEAADYIGGFPEHPHRGFETVTLMLSGRMRHRDHLGNEGVIGPGDVQWMSAARGILHSEMPEQQSGELHGFQLWINLAAREKMKAPTYRGITAEQIPTWQPAPGVTARVIAGDVENVSGPVQDVATRPMVLDMTLQPGTQIEVPTSASATVLAYVFAGEAALPTDSGDYLVSPQQMARLQPGTHAGMSNPGEQPLRVLLLAAEPIKEPVVHYGPFVMNTHEEIDQALADYRNGTLTSAATQEG